MVKDLAWRITLAVLFFFQFSTLYADPFPPQWSSGSGLSIHYQPVAWPSEPSNPVNCGDTCGDWKPYTRFQNGMKDPRTQDQSNGGTSPQAYVNVTSSCDDTALPSIYYYLYQGATEAEDVLMFRWRVESAPQNYATGPSAGNFGASNPWSSALWSVLFDVDGSGFRSLAAHLDGSSGAPATPVDMLVGIWGNTASHSLDYINDSNIHLLGHNPTAFIGATNKILNFQNSLTPVESWPNGSAETVWDYGTTRARQVTRNSCSEYFIDYQIPIAMLDASGLGGPSITRNTPIAMLFCTANSLNNPFQKDCAINKSWTADSNKPAPFGDYLSFNKTEPYSQPIISSIKSTAPGSCPGSYTLQATVQDTLALQNGEVIPSVQSVDFYYWFDADGNGQADDVGSSWTQITPTATLTSGTVNQWSTQWDASALPKGKYLVGAQALDDNTQVDDGMTPSGVNNRTFSYLEGDTSNEIYIGDAWKAGEQSAFPDHSPLQSPSAAEDWYGNPDVTGQQIAIVGTAINVCGISPDMTIVADTNNVAAGGTVTYTITISNPASNSSAITVSEVADVLPDGFTYDLGTTVGSNGFGNSNPAVSGQTLTWTFGSPVSILPGASASFDFSTTATTVSGVYNTSSTATSSFGELAAGPVSISVDAARITLSSTPDSYSVAADDTDQITFTLAYSNDSAVPVTSPEISITLPAGVTYVSCGGGTICAENTGVVSWSLADLAASDTGTVTLTLTVPNTWNTSSLTIASTIAGTAPDSSSVTDTASSTVAVTGITIPGTPDFSLSVSASAVRIAPAGSVIFTINYENYGTATASNVVITNSLPAGMNYSSCNNSCVNTNGTVTWSLGNIASGATGSVTVTATAANPFTFPNPATDSASIDWDSGTTVTAQTQVGVSGDYCDAIFYFHQGADNVLNTIRPASQTAPSLTSDYTTTLSNISENNFDDFTVETNQVVFEQDVGLADALDISNLTLTINYYLSASQGGGRTRVILRNQTTNTTIATSAEYTISTGATSLYTFTATIPPGVTINAGDKLRWYFQFRASGGKDITFHYDSISYNSRSSFCTTTSPASLNVAMSVDSESITAATTPVLTYTLKYANLGGTNATNTALTAELPLDFTNCEYSTNGSTWLTCSGAASNPATHVFAYNPLATATAGTVYVRGTVPAGTSGGDTLTATASIDSDQTNPVSGSAITNVVASGGGSTPSLVLDLATDKTSAVPGDQITYTVTVVNVGDGDASSVVISNALPIQSYFTYDSCTGGCSNVANTLSWNVGSLLAGASQSYTYTMTVGTSGLSAGVTLVTDDASASGNGGLTATSNSVSVAINGNPQLAVVHSATPNSGLSPGDTITFSMTITNNGSATATSVSIIDPIPANTAYKGSISASAGSGTFDTVNNRVVFSLGDIAAGNSVTASFQVTINDLASGNTTITNSANISAANVAQQTSSANASASATPDLRVSHSISGSAVYPATTLTAAANSTTLFVANTNYLQVNQLIAVNGNVARILARSSNSIVVSTAISAPSGTAVVSALTLNIQYQNDGNAPATSVVLTDTLPTGLGYYSSTPTADSHPSSGNSGDVVWNIGDVPAGNSGSMQAIVFPTGTTGVLTSSVLLEASNNANQSASADVIIGGIAITKSTSTPVVAAGTTASYTIQLTNSLASPVNGITVTDLLPAGFSYQTSSAVVGGSAVEPSFDGADTTYQQPSWSGLSVPALGSLTITFDADIDANAGAGVYQNELAVDLPGGVGLLPFDPLQSGSEDVTVLASGEGVLQGYVFERVNGTTSNFEPGNDIPLANVRVEVYQSGADCNDPYSATCYVIYTDNDGFFTLTLTAQDWLVKVVSNTGDLDPSWTQSIGDNDTAVTVLDQDVVVDQNGFEALTQFTVSTSSGTGGSISPTSATVNSGDTTSFTITPSTGYSINTVSGCGGSLSGNTYTTAAITAACTVSATFTLNSYTVTPTAGTGGSISPATAQSVNHGSTTSFTITPATGYSINTVSGCGGSLSGNTYTTAAITAACTVSATFTLNSYTVTPTAGTGGSISPATAQSVNHGDTTSFTITPTTGYSINTVSGCGGSLSGNTFTTAAITAACTVSATFTLNSYTVTPTAGTGGSISPATAQSVNHGSTTSFTITPATGYSINTVSGCGGSLSGNTFTTAAITAACTVSATFTLNSYTVTPTAGTGGSISPSTAQSVNHGSTTSFTITPDSGFVLISVDGTCGGSLAGNSFTTANVSSDCSVNAAFDVAQEIVDGNGQTYSGETIPRSSPRTFRITGGNGIASIGANVRRGGVNTELVSGSIDDFLADFEATLTDNGDGTYTFSGSRSGRYTFVFIDGNGQQSIVEFTIHPQIGFTTTSQPASVNNIVTVTVLLDDLPVEYPAVAPTTVTNSALTDSLNSDEDFAISTGRSISLQFIPLTSSGEIEFAIDTGNLQNAIPGSLLHHRVYLEDIANLPLATTLQSEQNSEIKSLMLDLDGLVTLNASLVGPGYSYDWSESDPALGIENATTDQATFDPTGMSGIYKVVVNVTETSAPFRTATAELYIRIVTNVPSEYDDTFGSNYDQHPNRLPICTDGGMERVTACQDVLTAIYMETLEHHTITLGSASDFASWRDLEFALSVEEDDLRDSDGNTATNANDRTYDHLGYLVDFEISGLDHPGQSVPVVIPLEPGVTIVANSVWRKFHPDSGWQNFVENDANQLASTSRRADGSCPWPGDAAWENGLIEGYDCVRLIIEDGGPNDEDGNANTIVKDPSILAVPKASSTTGSRITTKGKGGGSVDAWMLIVIALLAVRLAQNRSSDLKVIRNVAPSRLLQIVMSATLFCTALPLSSTPLAEERFYANGTLGQARGEVGSAEMNALLADFGYDAQANVDGQSRVAWGIGLGYQWREWLAAEINYLNLGEVTSELAGTDSDILAYLNHANAIHPRTADGFDFGIVLRYPITERFYAFGRGSILVGTTDYTADARIIQAERSHEESSTSFGFGLDYQFQQRWTLRGGWHRYRVEDENIDLFAMTLLYRIPDLRSHFGTQQ